MYVLLELCYTQKGYFKNILSNCYLNLLFIEIDFINKNNISNNIIFVIRL